MSLVPSRFTRLRHTRYYVNIYTKASVWERPSHPVYPADVSAMAQTGVGAGQYAPHLAGGQPSFPPPHEYTQGQFDGNTHQAPTFQQNAWGDAHPTSPPPDIMPNSTPAPLVGQTP